MRGGQTWCWWVTRIELSIAIYLVFIGLDLIVRGVALAPYTGAPLSVEPLAPFTPWGMLALLGSIAGLTWGRAFGGGHLRGPIEEPPPLWRHRPR